MFFRCPKCKKTWQYPVGKCPECFLKLERLKSEKLKVIGISKVNIPSIFHPKVPYFVLLLEDENGNKWVQKSVREYQIGELYSVKHCSEHCPDKEAVAIWRVKYDILEAIEKVIDLLGNLTLHQKSWSAAKTLLLPSLISPKHSYFAENTSPEFLEAVLDFLFKKGIKPENIKVVSQSFDEVPIGAKAQKSGLLEICQKNKVMPVDLASGSFIKKAPHQNFGRGLEISEEVFKSDLILNLPILKMGKASATENLFFVLKKENFLAQKYLYSEKDYNPPATLPAFGWAPIFEKLREQLPEYLTLAEANYIQDEKGFTHYLNLVLASFSPQNLDRAFFEIIKNEKLPEILEDVKMENIPIIGRAIEEVQI